jgi:hopene-associated glycosyltransferase HpnB
LLLTFALIPVVIWCVLLGLRGGFWRIGKQLAPRTLPEAPLRSLAVVIPARDEAEHIGQTVSALKAQDYPGLARIFVVDDNSSDGTAEAASQAGATVISGKPLVPGWTGKLWAVAQGVEAASSYTPDFFLFTDADISHDRHSLSELVAIAENGRYDLTSFMVKLKCESFAERALIPAFVFFFLMLYPPRRQSTVGAAGGCVLIGSDALRKIGGVAAIRSEVIDDCALAKTVKRSGGRVWMGLTNERRSERSYKTFGEIGRMISRTAFNQLNHSGLLLAGTVAGLFLTYLLPLALLCSGHSTLAFSGGAAWLLMSIAYLPMVRFYKLRPIWSLGLPFVAAFYAGATVHSALQYWSGRGGQWKGRAQDVG